MELIATKTNIKSNDIDAKVKVWLEAFVYEAELFEIANDWEGFWRDYKEEPLTSLLATGIARADKSNDISLTREYPLRCDGKHRRSDLFLSYYKENQHFFFEAKYYSGKHETGFTQWSQESNSIYFYDIQKQLDEYVKAERMEEINTYKVMILFHSVNFELESDRSKYIEAAIQDYKLIENQFYTLITSEDEAYSAKGDKFNILEIVGYVNEA